MANTSILAAFERMWQHVVAIVGTKSDLDHNHDDKYYTEVEIDTKLSEKSDTSHSHTKADVGLGNVDNTADANKNVKYATSAGSATSATKATQDGNGKVISSTYETKTDASAKLTEAKTYTDTVVSGKADKTHNHDTIYDAKGSATTAADTALASAKSYTDTKTSGLASTNYVDSAIANIPTKLPMLSGTTDDITPTQVFDAMAEDRTIAITYSSGGLGNIVFTSFMISSGLMAIVSTGVIEVNTNIMAVQLIGRLDNDEWMFQTSDIPQQSSIDALQNELDTHNHDSAYDVKGAAADSLASAKSYTDTKTSGLASTSTVDTKISTHNTSTSAHNDIRALITELTNRLNALADSDDTTLDQMSEIVAYIKSNKDLIDAVTTSKVNVSDIVNNLTTNVTNKPLSAAQGVAIKALIDALQTTVNGKADSLSDLGVTATATELNYVDGVTSNVQTQLDGKASSSHNHIYYGVCSTDAETVAKTVTIDNFSLVTGAMVIVKFTKANSASNPTLNVNNTGAKPMYRYGTTAISTGTTTTGWYAGSVQVFVYDGTGWIRDYWNNTTYSNVSLGQGYATCSTAASTVAKVATLSSYALTTGGIVAVKFTYDVPASATLNINSKGAKSIYYRGAAITSGIIKAGDVATFIYTSQYHLLSIDRWQSDIESKQEIITGGASTITSSNLTASRALVSDSSGKVAVSDVTSTELGYLDGVTSNIQTQLDGKAPSEHTHNYAGSSSAGGAATSANKVNSSLTVKLNGGTTEGTNMFTFNGSGAKEVNITPSAIGAASSSHTHDDRYYTETEIDTKISTINTAINGKAASSHTHDASDISGTFAGTATYAVSAGSSSKATSATSATYATTATNAGSASKATSATSATYASTATKAGTATYASNSRTYVGATTAASGTTGFVPAATTATRLKFLRGDGTWADVSNASTATYASSAGSASKATSATSATYASTATKAGTATYSTNAGTASYSSNGAKATSATSATYATTATKAGTATYATNAGTAAYSSNGAKATSATSATYATTATSSGTATKVKGTLTNPTSQTTYAIAFHSDISTGNKSMLNNDGFSYRTKEGTTSSAGYGIVRLGNSVASGTAGNKYGQLDIFAKTAARGSILQPDISSDVVHNLPSASGTLLNNKDFTVSNGVLTLNFL